MAGSDKFGGVVDPDQADKGESENGDGEDESEDAAGSRLSWTTGLGLLFWAIYSGLLALTGYSPPTAAIAGGFESFFAGVTGSPLVGKAIGTGMYVIWRINEFLFYDLFPVGNLAIGGYGLVLIGRGFSRGLRNVVWWLRELALGARGLGREILRLGRSGGAPVEGERRERYVPRGEPEKGVLRRSFWAAWLAMSNSVLILALALIASYLVTAAGIGTKYIDPGDLAIVTQASPGHMLEKLSGSGALGYRTVMSVVYPLALGVVGATVIAFAIVLGLSFTLFFTAHGLALPLPADESMPTVFRASVDALPLGPWLYYLVPAALLVIAGYHVTAFEELRGWRTLKAGLYIVPGYAMAIAFTSVFVFFTVIMAVQEKRLVYDPLRIAAATVLYPVVFGGIGGAIAHRRGNRPIEHPPLTDHIASIAYDGMFLSTALTSSTGTRRDADTDTGNDTSTDTGRDETPETSGSVGARTGEDTDLKPVFLENRESLKTGEDAGPKAVLMAADLDASVEALRDPSADLGIDSCETAEYYELSTPINLNAAAIGLGMDSVTTEPEEFPGLVYHHTDDNPGDAVLFETGEMVLFPEPDTDPEAFREAVENVLTEINVAE